MASNTDTLSLLSAALSASDPTIEVENLKSLYKAFQKEPGTIPPLFPTLVTLLDRSGEVLKEWIVQVIDLAFCRPTLGPQSKASLAPHMPGPLLSLLNDESLRHARIAITTFASVYQPLFKLVCADRSQAKLWQTLEAIKRRIVKLFDLQGHLHWKLPALKAFQKIILVQTRPGESRAASTSKLTNDAHLGMVPPDHPYLKPAALETEATERLTQIITIIFTSANPDLVMASMNSLATLAKFRQSLSMIVFEALISWTPSALVDVSPTLVRSVEKTLRLLYLHFHPSRNSWAGPYASQIMEAVETQKLRVDMAAKEEEDRKEKEATARRERIEEISGASEEVTRQKRKRVRFAQGDEEESIPTPSTTQPGQTQQQQQFVPSLPPPTHSDLADGRRSANAFAHASTLSGQDNPLAAFDVTTLPLHLVVELILANLQALTDDDLQHAITRSRANLNADERDPERTQPSVPPPLMHPGPPPGPPPSIPARVPVPGTDKSEDVRMEDDTEGAAQDPLKLDVGDEEVLDEAEKNLEEGLHDGQAMTAALDTFALKAPGALEAEDCKALMQASVLRICDSGAKTEVGARLKAAKDLTTDESMSMNAQLWSMLVIRLATRGFSSTVSMSEEGTEVIWKRQSDAIRQMMLDFVVADFASRIEFAVHWMAEEFFCEVRSRKLDGAQVRTTSQSAYAEWLLRLVNSLGSVLDSKDRSLMDFLNRVPHVPDSIIDTLQTLCLDKMKMRIGFGMLRELTIQREPTRNKVCSILLQLTRNEEKMIRSAAIITVRSWVRNNGTGRSEAGLHLEEMVLDAARDGLRRLTVRDTPFSAPTADIRQRAPPAAGESAVKSEDNESAATPSPPPSALVDPNKEVREANDVVRLVELPFALCLRVSEMLDDIFGTFPHMSADVQEVVKKTIVQLIQTLGPNNAKLLALIRRHPPGSESLAVCVFSIMTEKQKSKKVVDLVKEMAEEKSDIDPRFLIPILPDLVKSEIIKYLPRVVTILSSEKPEDRATIKAVLASIVTMPAQGFGSISTNLPRVRSSELLNPVELMSLLHHSEREIGLKTTAEAIRICFGMTDIFHSEVLGAVLNLILEEPNLPVLFMRTAIMAVRTYKSLSSYISTIFLSRLITKKVWQQPLLWDGFVLCAKQTAPASFGALIQLPKEQLRDVITRQPDLRTGLREYLVKKAGGHKVRLKNFLELLGESTADEGGGQQAGTPNGTINASSGNGITEGNTPDSQHSTPQPNATEAS